MTLIGLMAPMAFAPPPAPGTAPNPTAQMLQMLGTFAILGIIFYFVLIRPQQTKAKEHASLVKSLRPGDKVLTNGGIIGVIVSVKEKSVSIRSSDTKLEILKSAVSEVTEKAANSTE